MSRLKISTARQLSCIQQEHFVRKRKLIVWTMEGVLSIPRLLNATRRRAIWGALRILTRRWCTYNNCLFTKIFVNSKPKHVRGDHGKFPAWFLKAWTEYIRWKGPFFFYEITPILRALVASIPFTQLNTMICSLASVFYLASIVSAVPFKRYQNASDPVHSLLSQDTTITVDKYVTVTLPSTTMTLPATSSDLHSHLSAVLSPSADPTTITSYLTQYTTIADGSSSYVTPYSTLTSTITTSPKTTSTITSFVTITQTDGSVSVAACKPSTVTVTVTAAPTTEQASVFTGTTTHVSSYPIEAEFTNSGTTTTITSFVDVTSTQIFTSTVQESSTRSYQNGTYHTPLARRNEDMYYF